MLPSSGTDPRLIAVTENIVKIVPELRAAYVAHMLANGGTLPCVFLPQAVHFLEEQMRLGRLDGAVFDRLACAIECTLESCSPEAEDLVGLFLLDEIEGGPLQPAMRTRFGPQTRQHGAV